MLVVAPRNRAFSSVNRPACVRECELRFGRGPRLARTKSFHSSSLFYLVTCTATVSLVHVVFCPLDADVAVGELRFTTSRDYGITVLSRVLQRALQKNR